MKAAGPWGLRRCCFTQEPLQALACQEPRVLWSFEEGADVIADRLHVESLQLLLDVAVRASYLPGPRRGTRTQPVWTTRRSFHVECARKLHSNQSRVAKMEAGEESVSLDLLIRSLLGLGPTRQDVARVIGSRRSSVV